METSLLLLLLSLGVVLAGASEVTEIRKEEFAEQNLHNDVAKQAVEILMNVTLLDTNTSLIVSKNIMSSSLLKFGEFPYGIPKVHRLSDAKGCCNEMMIWRKLSKVNGSCGLSNIFPHGAEEMTCGIQKVPRCSCRRGKRLGVSSCGSADLELSVCQLPAGTQFPRCQYHSVTSLKKLLMVLTGHSLMSWLVSGSKL
ncbi:probable ribonuclease 11 [Ochotona curzoniae]|uniref:probable ribonuclease 11 n=1 Tax=Ochotona curzoniae TaxID=130825 RepID=UPI001B350FB3|nr:probable ribonuclease 11 [Ochotona curzoniae]